MFRRGAKSNMPLQERLDCEKKNGGKNEAKNSIGKTADIEDEECCKCSKKKRKVEMVCCEICKVSFNVKGPEYRKHLIKHSNLPEFPCDICSKKFRHKSNMTRHKIKVHGDAPLHRCKFCDFTTIHESYLQVHHTRKHTGDFQYACDQCDRKFRIKADYRKHQITHDNNPSICDVCGITLPNRSSLYFHRNYKHRVKDTKFQCPICKKKLQNQKNLDNHVKQHSVKYTCDECGVELTRKTALRKHIKGHSGEKPYACHICAKVFASTTSRKVHLLTHSGVRAYICTVCGQSFTQRPALSVHWKKQHPDIAFTPPSVSIISIIENVNRAHNKAKNNV